MAARARWMKLFPQVADQIRKQKTATGARRVLRRFLSETELRLADSDPSTMHALEYYIVRRCRLALETIFSVRGERLAGFSAAEAIWRDLSGRGKADNGNGNGAASLEEGFWQEMVHLFLGVTGESHVYKGAQPPKFLAMEGRAAGRERSRELNRLGKVVSARIRSYTSGLEPAAVERREGNRARVLSALGGTEAEWKDYRWQLRHLIRDTKTLGKIARLTADEREAIDTARANSMPFAITPYYATLMDREAHRRRDHAVRAQVIPPMDYVRKFAAAGERGIHCLDFMGETDTSPVDIVTRRYPQIAIFKPFNTCAQICVYCQRNWEIDDAMEAGALAPKATIDRALAWFRRERVIEEVLITGGDPLMLPDRMIAGFLEAFSRMPHIKRVRIGSRAPAVLPMRFTRELADVLREHANGRQQIALVTHFEHAYEATPEAREAVTRVREAGVSVYNQQVFTIENSRKFETAALRMAMKAIGVDPYYCFCAKGKEETEYYRVPIARLLQERKEEARLTPGSVRLDEPVFNVPHLGKNYLRAGQDHHVISVLADGSRVYEFLPWEKNLYPSPTYVHRDVPIYEYLQRLKRRGEDVEEYRNIWYYL